MEENWLLNKSWVWEFMLHLWDKWSDVWVVCYVCCVDSGLKTELSSWIWWNMTYKTFMKALSFSSQTGKVCKYLSACSVICGEHDCFFCYCLCHYYYYENYTPLFWWLSSRFTRLFLLASWFTMYVYFDPVYLFTMVMIMYTLVMITISILLIRGSVVICHPSLATVAFQSWRSTLSY